MPGIRPIGAVIATRALELGIDAGRAREPGLIGRVGHVDGVGELRGGAGIFGVPDRVVSIRAYRLGDCGDLFGVRRDPARAL